MRALHASFMMSRCSPSSLLRWKRRNSVCTFLWSFSSKSSALTALAMAYSPDIVSMSSWVQRACRSHPVLHVPTCRRGADRDRGDGESCRTIMCIRLAALLSTLDGARERSRPATFFQQPTVSRPHCRGALAEQELPCLVIDDRLGADRFALLVRRDHPTALAHRLEPALEVREVIEVLLLTLVRHDPWIARHVRNRVRSGNEIAARELLVEHRIEARGLLDITLDCIADFLWCVGDEVVVLAGHRP